MTRSFEWDSEKSKSNLEKHGIDFETATAVWNDPNSVEVEAKRIKGESRFGIIGMISGNLYTVFITYRNQRIRIFSARSPSRLERNIYAHQD